jgi:hypothetical protein
MIAAMFKSHPVVETTNDCPERERKDLLKLDEADEERNLGGFVNRLLERAHRIDILPELVVAICG